MADEKYGDLSGKDPLGAATLVGEVDKSNYLAHTIREIQHIIYRVHGRHYHINTHMSDKVKETCIVFFQGDGCDIYLSLSLSRKYEYAKEPDLRLALAHELGHLFHNIGRLQELSGPVAFSAEAEVFAWEFAYNLVMVKSLGHSEDIERGKHIFRPKELKARLEFILDGMDSDVRDRVIDAVATKWLGVWLERTRETRSAHNERPQTGGR